MKIDLHCHTLNCKKGDGKSRNVTSELFKEKIEAAGVEIVAITNHNYFDVNQYYLLKDCVKNVCEVWPGIEFDVIEKGNKPGHVLVICNPKRVEEFSDIINEKTKSTTPDDFTIKVTDLCRAFNKLDVVYIPHFFKDHQLCDDDMELLEKNAYSKKRILQEPSDVKSLGVLNSNGYKSIIGSDVKDWNKYENYSFAELKYPIKGFDNFLKILDKDSAFINDLLNKDLYDEITVYGKAKEKKFPFVIKAYNDVNVIFGDKGSGKSQILDSLEIYFTQEKGMDVVKFTGGDKSKWFESLLKVDGAEYSHEIIGVDDCSEKFKNIYNYKDKLPKKIETYCRYFENVSTNKKRKELKILTQTKTWTHDLSKYKDYYEDYRKIVNFEKELSKMQVYKNNKEKYSVITEQINQLKVDSYSLCVDEWKKQWADYLTDDVIEKLDTYSSQSDGSPEMPKETGFYQFCKNRIELHKSINDIKNVLTTKEVNLKDSYIGTIGDKGSGYLNLSIGLLNCDNVNIVETKFFKGKKKNIQTFLKGINDINNNCYSKDLINLIATLKDKLTEPISSIDYFIYAKKEFRLDNENYVPSKGEMAILSLQYDLLNQDDKDIFLIDEPEVNLGSTYIESTIVPMIKNLAKSKKIIVIATHDANIATRTYPVTSILKKSSNNIYDTFQGSMFTNELININDKSILKWDEESENYLEGGSIAFKERGTLYGTCN